MKQLASLLLSSVFSLTAFAGGLEPEAVLVVDSDNYDWTGFYAGLNAGIVKHTMNMTDNDATSFLATIEQVANPKFTGGFQVGYRYQLDPIQTSGVFGIEFDGNFANAKSGEDYGSPYALYQLDSDHTLKNFWLLQLMGGIAADRTLLFIAAGLSWSDITGEVTNVDGIPFFDEFDVNKKAFGTTVGGGIEYAFTEAFSARFEVDVITPRVYTTDDDTDDDFQISNNIVRSVLQVNYNFK